MLSLGRASLRTVVIVFGILFCSVPIVTIALNTISTGFQVGATQTQIDAHGVCHNVQATDGQSYFVPTNTASEWSAFRMNKPSGVTLDTCFTSCPSTWPNSDSLCSNSALLGWTTFSPQSASCLQWCEIQQAHCCMIDVTGRCYAYAGSQISHGARFHTSVQCE